MFCTQCGNENRNDRKFCSECGAPLKDYTKPRENLLMPENLEKQKELVVNKNKRNKILNFIGLGLQTIAITLLIISFFVKNPADIILSTITLTIEIAYLIIAVIKYKKNKTTDKQIEEEQK